MNKYEIIDLKEEKNKFIELIKKEVYKDEFILYLEDIIEFNYYFLLSYDIFEEIPIKDEIKKQQVYDLLLKEGLFKSSYSINKKPKNKDNLILLGIDKLIKEKNRINNKLYIKLLYLSYKLSYDKENMLRFLSKKDLRSMYLLIKDNNIMSKYESRNLLKLINI